MNFNLLYGQQLDVELGSADRAILFTTARRQKAINDAMHNFERVTSCTPVFGTIALVPAAFSALPSAAGSGYVVNDTLTLTGGTFTTAATFTVTAVTASGAIVTLALANGGIYSVIPANPVYITGGTGTLATLTVVFAGPAESNLLLTFPNWISFQERAAPSIKQVDPQGNITWIQGDHFVQRNPVWLDRQDPGWRADPPGVPMSWYLRDDAGSTFLGVDPAPSFTVGWTYTVLVPYLCTCDDLVSDGDTPFSVNGNPLLRLQPYHQALVHYAAGLLEPLRKNYSGTQRQMSVYAGYVAQYLTKQRRDGPDQVTFARNYLGESRMSTRAVDPHRWP